MGVKKNMRLFTSEEMRAIDKHSIEQMGISGLVLMENAGIKSLLSIEKILNGLSDKRFVIVCGKGCNGGDGFVIARHLFNHRIAATVFCTADASELSPDAKTNYEIFIKCGGQVIPLKDNNGLNKLIFAMEFSECLIDCVFGTGIKGDLKGFCSEVVLAMNKSRAVKISIDLPSGLNGSTGEVSTPCFSADYTITLGVPKLGLFMPPGMRFAGEVWVADISLCEKSISSVGSHTALLTAELCAGRLKPRFEYIHKGEAGKVLIIAGSKEYPGAPIMASYGALRSGAGAVRLLLPDCLENSLPFQPLPETVINFIPSKGGGFAISETMVNSWGNHKYGCALIGSGWGTGEAQKASLSNILNNWQGSLVIDADALNLITDLNALKSSKAQIIITPHLGEMARLTKRSLEEIKSAQIEAAVEFAKANRVVVVLKSSVTVIADYSGQAFICSRENSVLARAGSGDLLAGLICGIASSGHGLLSAAAAGVWLHSEAAAIAREQLGADAATISEVASLIPAAFKKIRG